MVTVSIANSIGIRAALSLEGTAIMKSNFAIYTVVAVLFAVVNARLGKVVLEVESGVTIRYIWSLELCGQKRCFIEIVSGSTVSKNGESVLFPPPVAATCNRIRIVNLKVDTSRSAFGNHNTCSWMDVPLKSLTGISFDEQFCFDDQYESCSFWRCTCKSDGVISYNFYDENSSPLRPSYLGNLKACASNTGSGTTGSTDTTGGSEPIGCRLQTEESHCK